jgi:TRAP-type C4-dicarboxylate transport system substrate-binding protein
VTRTAATLLAAALAAGSAAGCGAAARRNAADKAGGSGVPVVLRIADPYDSAVADAEALRIISDQITRASHGTLRIHIVYNAAGQSVPGVEAKVAKLVQQGRFDLGWIGTRAWDEVGLDGFQALQAPFLITDYRLLDEVVTGPLARQMLGSLSSRGLVGIVLVPDLLRHPTGIKRPLVSLADFKGARIRDVPSRASDALLRALGATPVHVANADVGAAIARGQIDGQELAIIYGFGSIITGNVSFFPKVLTLFAGQRAFDRLTDQQKSVLLAADERLRQHIWAPSENKFIRMICADRPNGHVVLASRRELVELRRAAQPVYAELERNPRTKAQIAAIRRLKASLPPAAPIVAPPGCGTLPKASPTGRAEGPVGALNGTYRWLLTESGARAFGLAGGSAESRYPLVVTAVLRDGKLVATLDRPPDTGTYSIQGDRIILRIDGAVGMPLEFRFIRDRDGTIRLRPVLPMDRGDQWVWSGAPWHRVGPPTRIG